MHKVGLVLQQLVYALYDVPLPEHDFVPHGHELVPHIGPQSVYEVYTLVEEGLEEFPADVSPVGEHLAVEFLGEHPPDAPIPIIDVCACKTERYHLPRVVAEQVQLEAVAPSHRAFPVFGNAGEDLVEIPPHIVADWNHRTVDERYARTLAEGVKSHEQQHLQKHTRHKFHKAVVGDRVWELLPQHETDAAQIVVLECAVSAEMVTHQNGHYLALGKAALAVSVTLAATNGGRQAQVFLQFCV